jgi:WD40 repeat protein
MSDLQQQLSRISNEKRFYVLRHLPRHLAVQKDCVRLYSLLTDIFFLESKTQEVSVFDLATDFTEAIEITPDNGPYHKILRLLEEAILKDIHFIDRHVEEYPQALFQCLWNSCWWYDSPESTLHYKSEENTWLDEILDTMIIGENWLWIIGTCIKKVITHFIRKAISSSPKRPSQQEASIELYKLMESWLEAKEDTCPGFYWMRSLRPPHSSLGSGLGAVFPGHDGTITAITCSLEGDHIASASDDGSVQIWDTRTGRQLKRFDGHTQSLKYLSFSANGGRLASASDDGTICLWDTERAIELSRFHANMEELNHLVLSADGRHIATASLRGILRVWDTDVGSEVFTIRLGDDSFLSIAYSPDGQRIAAGSYNGVWVWDTRTQKILFRFHGHKNEVTAVTFSPDGRRIISGSGGILPAFDKTVRVWDLETEAESLRLRGHRDGITQVVCSPDGRRIISVASDDTIRFWDAQDGKELKCYRLPVSAYDTLAVDPYGGYIVSGSQDGLVQIWHVQKMRESRYLLDDNQIRVECIRYSPDGSRIATAGVTHSGIEMWDAQNGRPLDCLTGEETGVVCITWSPDNIHVVGGSLRKTVHLWDSVTCRKLRYYLHKYSIRDISYMPDGNHIVFIEDENKGHAPTAWIWDVKEPGQPVQLGKDLPSINCVVCSPKGQAIAGGYVDGTIRIWDFPSLQETNCLRGNGSVSRIAYSSDGRRIVSAHGSELYGDLSVWLWDTEMTECLELHKASNDISGNSSFLVNNLDTEHSLFRTLIRENETAVFDLVAGKSIAWFPVELSNIDSNPTHYSWAGANGNHLYVIALEGQAKGPTPRYGQVRHCVFCHGQCNPPRVILSYDTLICADCLTGIINSPLSQWTRDIPSDSACLLCTRTTERWSVKTQIGPLCISCILICAKMLASRRNISNLSVSEISEALATTGFLKDRLAALWNAELLFTARFNISDEDIEYIKGLLIQNLGYEPEHPLSLEVRQAALDACTKIGRSMLPQLLKVDRTAVSWRFFANIVLAAGKIDSDNEQVRSLLSEAAHHPEAGVKMRVLMVLEGNVSPWAKDIVRIMEQDPSPEITDMILKIKKKST